MALGTPRYRRLEEHPPLGGGDALADGLDGVRIHRDGRDALAHEVLGEGRAVRRGLSAQRRGDAGLLAPSMMRPMASSTAGSASSKTSAQIWESRSTPEHQLSQVVAADRHAGDPHGGVGRDPVGHRGHLCHHPDRERTRHRAGVDHVEAGLELPGRAHERDHQHDVRRLLQDAGQHVELEPEQVGLAGRSGSSRGTRSSGSPRAARTGRPPRGWRTRWTRKSMLAVHDGRGSNALVMRSSDLAMLVDERLLVAALEEQAAGVPAQCVGHHELGPQKTNAVDGEGRHLFGVLGEGQVDVDPGRQRSGPARSRPRAAEAGVRRPRRRRHGSFGHRPVAAVDGDELAVAQ